MKEKEVKVEGSFVDNALLWKSLYEKCIAWNLIEKDSNEYPSVNEMKKLINEYNG